nr:putative wax ester synthase/acyl-CoA:diacylglycerol acyltransferase [uncultured bacterium]
MKKLTGLDASFLSMEGPTTVGHVAGLAIYRRPRADFDPYREVFDRINAMVGRLEPLRRRLVEVPFNIDHPYWIEDPDFDLEYHVRELALAPPGAADQLADQVARIVGRHLDRSRPLWEAYVIEGLGDDRWALLWKTHHAAIDGAAGVLLLNMFTDLEPDAPVLEPVEWTSEPIPSSTDLLTRSVQSLATNPVKGVRLGLKLARNVADGAGVSSVSGALSQAQKGVRRLSGQAVPGDSEQRVRMPLSPAPPTPWNATISAHRRFAMRSTALANIKALKDASGGTLNDVVMAICTGALRQYLLDHDALPNKPLRAMVPVSVRTGDEEDPWTNRVSGIIAELPTDLADPLERLARCSEAMSEAKKQFDLVPAETMIDAAQTMSPVVATAATRLASRLRLADRVNLPANVTISNVPGPRQPLYFAGAKLDNYIPVSIVTDGMGLNITVHSYLDRLDFGLIADRELVPDLWDLVDLHADEVEVLMDATGAAWAEPPRPPAMRKGSVHVQPVPAR